MIDQVVCSECCSFMSNLKNNSIKLTVTSPPYDVLRLYNCFTFNFELTAQHLLRITEEGGVVVWVVGDQTKKGSETGTSFKQALHFMSLGFKLHDTMIYAKKNFIPQTHNRYEQEFEYMFVFVKGKLKTFNPILVTAKTAGDTMKLARKGYGFKEGSFRRREAEITTGEFKRPGNIFYYACGASGKNHPAVFPTQLAADHINTWSNIGDLVFDPFVGSGTTVEQAKKLGRRYLGCDISQEYIDEIHKNLKLIENPLDVI
jgi:DNA modification methylase